MASVPSLIASLRILVNDTSTANQIRGETPSGIVNGSNRIYKLQNPNVVDGSVFVTYDATFRGTTGFTIDLPTGYLTMTAAPVNGKTFFADYAWYWFTDTDLTEFLTEASRMLLQGGSDPTTVANGLIAALLQYGAYFYWLRRAAQYAHRYNASTASAVSEQVDVITTNFRNMSMQAKRDGDKIRDDYYAGQGSKAVPAAVSVAFGIDPMTPGR